MRPAAFGVRRIYSQIARYEDLIAIFDRELANTKDREDKIQLLRRISELWENQLKEPAAALNSYERLISLDPSNLPALTALRRLYAMGNRWQDLVVILKTDAEQAMDRWRRVSLLTEAAEIQANQLKKEKDALQTFQEILDLTPTHQPALMACGRILFRQQ